VQVNALIEKKSGGFLFGPEENPRMATKFNPNQSLTTQLTVQVMVKKNQTSILTCP
jgi:hypothetical protein